jgi:hypothetical protein
MTVEAIGTTTTRKSRAWVVLFILGILLSLNMLFLLIVGGGTDQFESDTGVAWTELNSAYPTVAQQVIVQEQLLAIGFLGFALFISVIAYVPYRAGEKWSWYALLIMPMVLGLTAAVMLINGATALGAFYAVFAAAAVLPLAFSVRTYFPKQ